MGRKERHVSGCRAERSDVRAILVYTQMILLIIQGVVVCWVGSLVVWITAQQVRLFPARKHRRSSTRCRWPR